MSVGMLQAFPHYLICVHLTHPRVDTSIHLRLSICFPTSPFHLHPLPHQCVKSCISIISTTIICCMLLTVFWPISAFAQPSVWPHPDSDCASRGPYQRAPYLPRCIWKMEIETWNSAPPTGSVSSLTRPPWEHDGHLFHGKSLEAAAFYPTACLASLTVRMVADRNC